ncbi:hypothetical protein MTR_1g036260 [Medicago truncatula]|uniref:Uncharacterized protein n=1 Tax=Medicago truncatula TaxID=3880 RepID=A0A072VGX8_MEDTR|nr:hypothetical protein MTR_1g036260 [Medicago truncatula]
MSREQEFGTEIGTKFQKATEVVVVVLVLSVEVPRQYWASRFRISTGQIVGGMCQDYSVGHSIKSTQIMLCDAR